ncbi:MAG: histidinol-phosphate transaminase [Myxococcota bacterium]
MDDLAPEHIQRLIPYVPGKPIEELERELGIQGAVKLASNENPVGPSPKVLEVIANGASEVHRYPDGGGYVLKQALSKKHEVSPEELCLGNGSNELIDMLCRAFATPGAHVVFGDPSFVCYWLGATASNLELTKVPLREQIHWDVDALLEAVTPETKLLFLANPNNPTGTYVAAHELERLLRELPENVIAVVDEAYFELATAADYQTALQLRSARERLVVLRTFSKAYGLAALRIGYAVAPAPIVDYLNRVRAPFNVGSLGQRAALAALSDPEHMARYVELNARERDRVAEGIRGLGLRQAPSQANFILVDFERPGKEVYDALLRKGVIVRPMPPPIATWLRITIGLPEENDRMLAAAAEVLDGFAVGRGASS